MALFPDFSISTDPLSVVNLLITSFVGSYIFYRERRIGKVDLEMKQDQLIFQKEEFDFKRKSLEKIEFGYKEISNNISKQLINNHTWLDTFMEKTGATYGGSLFGSRIGHFYYEKQQIARNSLDCLNEVLKENNTTKYCFLIDSGTTLYHFFVELCEEFHKNAFRTRWCEQVCIVTNNLPGVQYLMKNCRDQTSNEYSEIPISCFLLPGKPLSVYGAVTGDEACDWLDNKLETYLNKLWGNGSKYKIISLMSANYIVRKSDSDRKDSFYPVARGEGHTKIKNKFSDVSDEIFIFSPLTKFSFASIDELNGENGLQLDENDKSKSEEIKNNPSKVKYNQIEIKKDHEKCTFFTTRRADDNLFFVFGDVLVNKLKESYEGRVVATIFDIKKFIPNGFENERYHEIQIKEEIPHEILRANYLSKKEKENKETYIWDTDWIKTSVPVSNFSTDVITGCAPLAIKFTDLSKNANGWNWDFGDGTTSTEQNPTHTYSVAGTYTVSLTVKNAAGSNTSVMPNNIVVK